MASRGGTAAPQSQAPSISKPSRSQTRTSQGRSNGQTRGSVTQASGRTDNEGGSQLTRTASRRQTATAGKPQSLFEVVKQAQAQDSLEGEGVKANDIWNKFVSDDQNVVRAPTAQSSVGGTRSSQRSRVTEASQGSQGSKRPSQIDEEEEEEEEESSDDDRTIYSDYYLPPEYIREEGTPGPRAEIEDSHEACSCFPNRSDKFIGSMLYDKITCQHTGLTGHTQPGVFKFNPFWNENMEEPRRLRKRDMRIARIKFVFGYPKPKFELMSESEDDNVDEEHDGSREQTAQLPSREAYTPKTAKTSQTRETRLIDDEEEEDEDSEYGSEEYDSEDEDEEDEDFIPYQLPQIGYPQTPSLPPSSQSFRSRYSEYSDVPDSLPELPTSRQFIGTTQTKRTGVTQKTQRTHFTRQETRQTAKTNKTKLKTPKKADSVDSGYDDDVSKRTTASRQSLPTGPVVSTTRIFQGRFYDPVTKQVMLYDIGTRPGQRIPTGNLEPLYKPQTVESKDKKASTKDEPSSKPGTKGSKRSNTSQQSNHSVPKAAVLGGVFLSHLLSKNKANRDAVEAGYDDENDANG